MSHTHRQNMCLELPIDHIAESITGEDEEHPFLFNFLITAGACPPRGSFLPSPEPSKKLNIPSVMNETFCRVLYLYYLRSGARSDHLLTTTFPFRKYSSYSNKAFSLPLYTEDPCQYAFLFWNPVSRNFFSFFFPFLYHLSFPFLGSLLNMTSIEVASASGDATAFPSSSSSLSAERAHH
ncbi:hypothetical protein JOM56_002599 [Amanita muscaria]